MARPIKWKEGYKVGEWTITSVANIGCADINRGKNTMVELGCPHCGNRKWYGYKTLSNGFWPCECGKHTQTSSAIKNRSVCPPEALMKASSPDGTTINTAKGSITVYKGYWYYTDELEGGHSL